MTDAEPADGVARPLLPDADADADLDRIRLLQERSISEGWAAAPLGNFKPAAWVMYVFVLLSAAPNGLTTPVLPMFEVQFFSASDCDVYEDDDCGDYSTTSFANATADSLAALMCVMFAQTVGLWSDCVGRRPVLLVSAVLGLLPQLALYLTESLWPYYALSVATGVFGTSMALNPAVAGYLSDVTTSGNRSRGFAWQLAMQLVALAVAPVAGALLHEYLLSDRELFGVAAAVRVLHVLFALLIVPESLAPEARESDRQPTATRPWTVVRQIRESSRLMQTVCWMTLFASLPESGVLESAMLYLDDRLALGDDGNALFMATLGIVAVLVSVVGLPLAKRCVGELSILQFALFSNSFHMLFYAAAAVWTNWLLLVPIELFASIAFLYSPTMQGMVSRRLAQSEQGHGLGLLTAVTGFTGVLGPLLFGYLYGIFRKAPFHFPELPFLVGSAMAAVALVLAKRRLPRLLMAPALGDTDAAPGSDVEFLPSQDGRSVRSSIQ